MITLAEALKWYGRTVSPSKRGSRTELSRIRVLCRDELASRHLAAIRSSDLARFRDQCLAAGTSPSTVRQYFALISQTYKTAAVEWGCEGLQNPTRGVRMPPPRLGRDRRLEDDEEERLLAAARVRAPWLCSAITWSLETAMRRGEQLGLRRSDISGNIATLKMTKNGRPRFVPLSTRALAVLEDLPEVGRLWPYTEWQHTHYWRQVCRDARIEDLRWHDLRHEAISRLAERGLDMLEIMAISGHRTTIMLARYAHLRVARLAAKLG